MLTALLVVMTALFTLHALWRLLQAGVEQTGAGLLPDDLLLDLDRLSEARASLALEREELKADHALEKLSDEDLSHQLDLLTRRKTKVDAALEAHLNDLDLYLPRVEEAVKAAQEGQP